jgi:hypothetical protein
MLNSVTLEERQRVRERRERRIRRRSTRLDLITHTLSVTRPHCVYLLYQRSLGRRERKSLRIILFQAFKRSSIQATTLIISPSLSSLFLFYLDVSFTIDDLKLLRDQR